VWIIIKGQTLGCLVVCDNPVLKQIFKAKKISSNNLCINLNNSKFI